MKTNLYTSISINLWDRWHKKLKLTWDLILLIRQCSQYKVCGSWWGRWGPRQNNREHLSVCLLFPFSSPFSFFSSLRRQSSQPQPVDEFWPIPPPYPPLYSLFCPCLSSFKHLTADSCCCCVLDDGIADIGRVVIWGAVLVDVMDSERWYEEGLLCDTWANSCD